MFCVCLTSSYGAFERSDPTRREREKSARTLRPKTVARIPGESHMRVALPSRYTISQVPFTSPMERIDRPPRPTIVGFADGRPFVSTGALPQFASRRRAGAPGGEGASSCPVFTAVLTILAIKRLEVESGLPSSDTTINAPIGVGVERVNGPS